MTLQGLLKAEWHRHDVPADATVQTVIVDFCNRFCLSPDCCQMWHAEQLLQPNQDLQKVSPYHLALAEISSARSTAHC